MATVLPGFALTSPAPKLDIGKIGGEIVKGAGDYYTLKTQIDAAKYGAKIAKANLQNQLYATRATGQNIGETILAGGPSPSLLLVGALGLGALILLRR